ncbi:diaminopimelate epimerase [Dyadobacter sp. CY345]|uniref:diaminopimelate epimerase n=1 Tax=Dyadobacter sp. CY345 TaxID=2909335 RepID=UPI001F35B748|nr:diaminopimelate epimerase [Dyadobacter sp. CY345]MCF2443147.1 diaminopimelate epimerase [Dyadobacter sp. CY345]
MEIPFFKYQGTGNDFVMIDNRSGYFPSSQKLIESLCHRRFGIGADGLILLENAEGYDFRMVYFNADGREGSMCGNGGRCAVRFAHDLGMFDQETSFIAVDGPHEGVATKEIIRLKMGSVNGVERHEKYDFLNTGSPHYVTYVDDIQETEVVSIGKDIRYGSEFGPKGGTNVNFVQLLGENHISVRTYERGVEDETYSCGTGVTACVLSAHLREGWNGLVTVETLGGTLQVDYLEKDRSKFDDIYLIGPAVRVFEGNVNI